MATARVELVCAYGVEAADQFTYLYLRGVRANARSICLDALNLWEMHTSAAALTSMHLWGLEPAVEAKRRERTEAFFDRAAQEFLNIESPYSRAT